MNYKLKKDVLSVINSIYRMNAPNAIGYRFFPNEEEDKIAVGMFIHDLRELSGLEDGYYVPFAYNNGIFKSIKLSKRNLNKLLKK
jgi:hypothetical protein